METDLPYLWPIGQPMSRDGVTVGDAAGLNFHKAEVALQSYVVGAVETEIQALNQEVDSHKEVIRALGQEIAKAGRSYGIFHKKETRNLRMDRSSLQKHVKVLESQRNGLLKLQKEALKLKGSALVKWADSNFNKLEKVLNKTDPRAGTGLRNLVMDLHAWWTNIEYFGKKIDVSYDKSLRQPPTKERAGTDAAVSKLVKSIKFDETSETGKASFKHVDNVLYAHDAEDARRTMQRTMEKAQDVIDTMTAIDFPSEPVAELAQATRTKLEAISKKYAKETPSRALAVKHEKEVQAVLASVVKATQVLEQAVRAGDSLQELEAYGPRSLANRLERALVQDLLSGVQTVKEAIQIPVLRIGLNNLVDLAIRKGATGEQFKARLDEWHAKTESTIENAITPLVVDKHQLRVDDIVNAQFAQSLKEIDEMIAEREKSAREPREQILAEYRQLKTQIETSRDELIGEFRRDVYLPREVTIKVADINDLKEVARVKNAEYMRRCQESWKHWRVNDKPPGAQR